MTKKAFITGITGQDGSYLAEFISSGVLAKQGVQRFWAGEKVQLF